MTTLAGILQTRWADILDAKLHEAIPDREQRLQIAASLAEGVDATRDRYVEQLEAERDQYAAAARHMRHTVGYIAHVWSTTLPEMIRTADAAQALMRFASEGVDRPDLRDDVWQRIVGAYYVRFENDGHPEDAEAAADEAMAVVQPELDKVAAQVARVRALHVYVEDANYCDICSNHGDIGWPCATLQALDGAGGEVAPRTTNVVAAALRKRAESGVHLHHRDCIHNLPPERQVELRGRTVEWWERIIGPLPEQITPDEWETEPLDLGAGRSEAS